MFDLAAAPALAHTAQLPYPPNLAVICSKVTRSMLQNADAALPAQRLLRLGLVARPQTRCKRREGPSVHAPP